MDVYAAIKRDLILVIVFVNLILLFFNVFKIGWDSTDGNDVRSGLILYTDALTGCQYLSSWHGGLVPRFDRAGKHVCTRSS